MASQVYTAGRELENQKLRLATPDARQVVANITTIEPSSYDHVVETLADFPAPVAGTITLTSGSWGLKAPINLGANILLVPVGTTVYLSGTGWTNVLSGDGPVVEVRGNLLAGALAVTATAAGGEAILLAGIGATARLVECRLQASATGSCVRSTEAELLGVIGGEWSGALYGLEINGDLHHVRMVSTVSLATVNTFVRHIGGACESCDLQACIVQTSATGVHWPAVDLPSFNLGIEGCTFDTPAAISGFTELDLRATLRGNYDVAVGAMNETPIVPEAPQIFDHVVRSTADLPAPAGGFIDLTTGSWALAASVNVGADVLRVAAGVNAYVKGIGPEKVLTGMINVAVGGTLVAESLTVTSASTTVDVYGTLRATDCHFVSTGAGIVNGCVCAHDATTIIDCVNVNITSNTHRCSRCIGADFIRFIGGTWTGSVASVDGWTGANNPGRLEFIGVRGLNLDVFVDRGAVTGIWVGVFNCIVDCATGISWTAASVPLDGMAIMGNYFNTATPFAGFTAASPGFICRGNSGSAGLLTETALVP